MQRLQDRSLQTQIAVSHIIVIVTTTLISLLAFSYLNTRTVQENNLVLSQQRIEDLSSFLSVQLQDVNKTSKQILANSGVQSLLNQQGFNDRTIQWNSVRKELSLLVESDPLIESIEIVGSGDQERQDESYSIDSRRRVFDSLAFPEAHPLMGQVEAARGGAVMTTVSTAPAEGRTPEGRISFARLINDLETQKPLGVLTLRISVDSILAALREPELPVALKSRREDQVIYNRPWDGEWLPFRIVPHTDLLVGIPPVAGSNEYQSAFVSTAIAIILINGVFVFLSSLLVHRRFTHPLHELTATMNGQSGSELIRIKAEERQDEIGSLQRSYNGLVERIIGLMATQRRDLEEKRKAELMVLQAQIKPHFLYNSLDAIASLALRDGSGESYDALKRLGGFFRLSLSGGEARLSVSEEFAIVENYLAIQEIRNSGKFSVHFSLEAMTRDVPIIKLVLQPLVENALYHGIKPAHGHGEIHIRSRMTRDYLTLDVEDNGVGMADPDRAFETGYGLQNTRDRLRLAYGEQARLELHSVPGEGTIARIRVHRGALDAV